MKLLPVLKWMIAIILVATLVASGAVFYVLSQKEKLVQAEVLKQFANAAPDLELRIESTSLQGTRGATLHGLTIHERQSQQMLFRAEHLRVEVDSKALLEQQKVIVDRVHLQSADIQLTREADGRWNWQQYRFQAPPRSSGGLPVVVAENVNVFLTLKHDAGVPAANLLLRNSKIQAVPSSAQAYDFDGAIELPGAGLLKLVGAWNLKSRQWSLGGNLRDVSADERLMQLVRATAPQIDGQIHRLDSALKKALPTQTAAVGMLPQGAALQIGSNRQTALQFQGNIDMDFAVSGTPELPVPAFKLLLRLKDGRLATASIPFAVTDVQAKFFRDNESVVFELQNANGNDASLTGGFEMLTGDRAKPGHGWFDIRKFPVTNRLKPLLPERTLRLFDAFEPDLLVSVKGEFRQSATGKWQPHQVVAEVHEGSSTYHKFQYPAENLRATITQRPFRENPATEKESASTINDVVLDVSVQGRFGDRPFTAQGWWKNPGPVTETRFEMSVTDFPLDGRFRNALGEKEQKTLDSLDLEGMANADFIFYRPPGMDQVTQTFVDARLSKARMKFRRFPYEVEELSGHVTFDSATKHWRFLKLHGQHGKGLLTATGEFKGSPAPGELDLTVTATGASLDADLYNALAPSQRSIWNMINPAGHCDMTARINWTAEPGTPAIVSFPQQSPVRIYNTTIRPTPFPFDMKIQEAILSFDPNDVRAAGAQHCEIHSFQATHGEAKITARQCWAEAKPNGEWQLHLNHVAARDLQPDDQLRAALPPTWRQTLSRVHHVGHVSINDSELDFRGTLDGKLNSTARWDLNLTFRDCTLNAGLDVQHVFGKVTAEGIWDGYRLRNFGDINIETAEVLEMPFTNIKGPYSLNDVELVLGSRQVFEPDRDRADVDRSGRMKALAYGGELLFDASVDLRENGRYQFFTELANARLESYAALHIPDQQNLRGVVNAWMSLTGTGEEARDVSGKGQLLINPAALYEIPVIVNLLGSLSRLNPNIQNRTAFNYAIMDFTVADEAFDFKSIDLVGESISLRGRGSLGFGGAVNIDFYSQPARSRAAALPFISGLFTNWAKVEIRGTTNRPQTMVRPTARIDEGLKLFLQPFNPNPAGPIPRLNVPRVFQGQGPLIQRHPLQQAMQARQARTRQ